MATGPQLLGGGIRRARLGWRGRGAGRRVLRRHLRWGVPVGVAVATRLAAAVRTQAGKQARPAARIATLLLAARHLRLAGRLRAAARPQADQPMVPARIATRLAASHLRGTTRLRTTIVPCSAHGQHQNQTVHSGLLKSRHIRELLRVFSPGGLEFPTKAQLRATRVGSLWLDETDCQGSLWELARIFQSINLAVLASAQLSERTGPCPPPGRGFKSQDRASGSIAGLACREIRTRLQK